MKSMFKVMHSPSLGLLLLRLGVAAVFLYAGIGKLMHMDQVIQVFGTMGLSPFWAWLVALVETVGGAAMAFGIYTTIAGIALSVVMVVAIILVKWDAGFGAAQIDMMLLLASLAIALAGPGRFSLARAICGCTCESCAKGHCSGMYGVCYENHSKKK